MTGFHDHHIHLLALAAARRSVDVSSELAAPLRAAAEASTGWIRAVGYHESVAGDIDRDALDAIVPDHPVRVQHRSGARWTLNSAAIAELGISSTTGHVHRGDTLLRKLLPPADPPDLAPIGAELASYGVTAVTDMTPYADIADLQPLADAVRIGALPQRVIVTGAPDLAGAAPPAGLEWGPVKIVIDDGGYPALETLADQIALAHRHDRAVAIHCVTRTALALAIAGWDAAGSVAGDRVEHGAVIPPELRDALKRHALTIVTQPGFIAERGDDYLRDVDPTDLPFLYPCRTLLDAGVAVRLSTDAPYSDPDPRKAIDAAVNRRTRRGAVINEAECVDRETATALFASV